MIRHYHFSDFKGSEELPAITETPQIHAIILFDEKEYVVNKIMYDTVYSKINIWLEKLEYRHSPT